MKARSQIFLVVILIFGTGKGYAQLNENLVQRNFFRHASARSEITHVASVDDSMYFDLSVAYQVTSVVDIPIYFRSSNSVNSIDFALQFNNQKAAFDTIMVQVSNLQYMYYYNPLDSTLRFTSNSLSPFPQDSAVVIIRFHVFSGPFCSGDIFNTETWLNGELCSNQIINCVISDIEEIAPNFLNFYPNPAIDNLKLNSTKCTDIQITDVSGKLVQDVGVISGNEIITINISTLKNGIYLVHFSSNQSIHVKKLIIGR